MFCLIFYKGGLEAKVTKTVGINLNLAASVKSKITVTDSKLFTVWSNSFHRIQGEPISRKDIKYRKIENRGKEYQVADREIFLRLTRTISGKTREAILGKHHLKEYVYLPTINVIGCLITSTESVESFLTMSCSSLSDSGPPMFDLIFPNIKVQPLSCFSVCTDPSIDAGERPFSE